MITYTESEISKSPYTNYIQIPSPDIHNHTYWEIFIILSGNCEHTLNGKTTNLSAGAVFFLRPIKDAHNIKISNSSSVYRHRDIYISDEDMKTCCKMISPELYDELYNLSVPVSINISSSMQKYIEEILSSPSFQLPTSMHIMKNIHFSIAISLLTAYQITKLPTSTPLWLNQFVAELKKPDNFLLSIEELTAKIPYSHGYICREFRRHMKQTIVNFFNTQKINHASYLLMNTNYKILDISNMIGYSSPKNFIKQFTKTYLLSPSVWRAKNQISSRK